MKKLTLVLALLGVALAAAPASAEHTNTNLSFFFDEGAEDGSRWNETHTEHYCLSPEFDAALGGIPLGNVDDETQGAFNRWQTETDLDVEINYGDPQHECGWNLNFEAAYDNANGDRLDFCAARPSDQASSVQFESLSWLNPGFATPGYTWHCDVDNNGYLDYFVIVIDPTFSWKYGSSTQPANNEWSFPSVITHEIGHAYGFKNHWSASSDACPGTNAGHNTMCDDAEGAFEVHWNRTPESHDIGEVNQEYP